MVDGTDVVKPYQAAEGLANRFKLVYNNTSSKFPCNPVTSFAAASSDNLSLFPVTDADIRKAIKWLKPCKSVGFDGIPGFIIKGCIDIFVPLLKYIFSLSLSQQLFPSSLKQVAIVPIFKKGSSSLLVNYHPTLILNDFLKVFEFVIHDHISHYHYLQAKLNTCEHGLIKSRSTTSNLVIYLDYLTPLVSSQHQVDGIYFDFSSVFDLVSHTLLLGKLSPFGLKMLTLAGSLTIYLTGFPVLRFLEFFGSISRVLAGVPEGSVLGPVRSYLYIGDICNVITHSKFLLFADDIKIVHVIKSLVILLS
jgi:hypothetical protein